MLAKHPAISVLHTHRPHAQDARTIMPRVAANSRCGGALRSRRYDLVVHLTEHPRGAWLARLVGARYARRAATPATAGGGAGAFRIATCCRAATLRHTVETNLDALRRIGIWPDDDDKQLVLVPDAATRARAGVAARGARARTADASCSSIPARAGCSSAGRPQRPRRCSTSSPPPAGAIVLTGAPDPAERDAGRRDQGGDACTHASGRPVRTAFAARTCAR